MFAAIRLTALIPTLWAAFSTAPLLAASTSEWPPYDVDPDYFRADGFYLSVVKIALTWLLFLLWVRTTDWVNQDLQLHRFNYRLWNPIVVGTFAGAFILVWIIPWFAFGFILLLLAYAVPLGVYVFGYRNPKMAEHDQVLTPDHIKFWFSEKVAVIGVKIETEKRAADAGPDLELVARGGESKMDDDVNLLLARQSPGYLPLKRLLDEGLQFRSSAILIDVGEEAAVRYQIDGVWHVHDPLPREAGEEISRVLKILCAIDPDAVTDKQLGRFAIAAGEGKGVTIACELSCQRQGGAERVLVRFLVPQSAGSLEDLGMRPKMTEQIKELMGQENGLVIFSSLPTGGLSTTFETALRQTDRMLRDFVAIEDAAAREPEIVNVTVRTFDRGDGQSPATLLPAILGARPDVIICRDLVDGASATALCEAATERLVLVGVASKDAAEALLRVLVMKVPPAKLANSVKSVLHQRLIRKICPECREAYQPTPELCQRLGLPAGKVESLYRPPNEPKGLCEHCHGLGYRGRTAVFELLTVDDTIRKILMTQPQLDALRTAARQAKMVSERDHGILAVARGETSLEELQRVFQG